MTSDLFLLPDKCQADRRAGESNAKPRITNKRTDKPTRHRKRTPGPQTASGKNHRKIRINSIRLTMSVATVRLGVQPRKTRRVLVQKGASQPRRCCQRDCALVVPWRGYIRQDAVLPAGGAVLTLRAGFLAAAAAAVLWSRGCGEGRGGCGMHLSLCGQQEAVTAPGSLEARGSDEAPPPGKELVSEAKRPSGPETHMLGIGNAPRPPPQCGRAVGRERGAGRPAPRWSRESHAALGAAGAVLSPPPPPWLWLWALCPEP